MIVSYLYSRLPPSGHRLHLMSRRVISLGLLPHVRREHLPGHQIECIVTTPQLQLLNTPFFNTAGQCTHTYSQHHHLTFKNLHADDDEEDVLIHDPNAAHAYVGARKSDGVYT